MTGPTFQIVTLVVTVGAVAFAVAVGLWAYRMTAGARTAQIAWRRKMAELEDKLSRADSVFGAHPGLVLVWDQPPFDETDTGWGMPRLFGSSVALAALLRFALNNSPDGANELCDIDRLGHVLVDAGGAGLINRLRHSVARERDDVDRADGLGQLPDAARGLEAGHPRHVDIHQDHVIAVGLDSLERLHAVGNSVDRHPGRAENAPDQRTVCLVIIGDKDPADMIGRWSIFSLRQIRRGRRGQL